MLSIFWKSSCIFIILLNKWNLCAEITLTSAMRFLYFSHHCSYWSLWYNAIAMLLFIKIVVERSNYLHLNCILVFSWIIVFRSIIFLMTEKREVKRLISVSRACISLHARLVSCVLSLIQLCNVTLFCSMFKWTCSELIYVLISNVLMLTLLNASATWRRIYWKYVAYIACNIHKTWFLCWFFS